MNTKIIVTGLVAASLGFSSVSFAQPSHHHDRRDGREARHDVRDARRDLREDRRELRHDRRELRQERREARYYYNARGPEFRRGGHLPHELRDRHYVVSDWRGHRLAAPPRGYQWVQVGSDYVLVAIATGLIANLILSQ
ncbi:RcnB family protein [Ramlibacter alkalitolerans]|jgi:Ni/Co efflux regulator RcnB|uniref:RcnB family protein n=1 Tax=Ramlibacter alkalitolerans TaxID=2039631 RepID=A0ABS1JSJ9_9BURK|nr:RcnB family protein [Ramlibacter alkalitolerans]MBL0427255.1 RcnB family protein [Ramlibacter alkalitolerans]